MKFLLDENFPKTAKSYLEHLGHHVFDFRGTAEEGADDFRLFDLAQEHEAVMLTTDRDYFHTVPLLYESHHGVVVIALRQPNRAAIMQKLEWLFTQQKLFPLNNKVLQLRDETCRIRQSGNQIRCQ
jgi:predicted nuclease of predicted toxin-antitoxin system